MFWLLEQLGIFEDFISLSIFFLCIEQSMLVKGKSRKPIGSGPAVI